MKSNSIETEKVFEKKDLTIENESKILAKNINKTAESKSYHLLNSRKEL